MWGGGEVDVGAVWLEQYQDLGFPMDAAMKRCVCPVLLDLVRSSFVYNIIKRHVIIEQTHDTVFDNTSKQPPYGHVSTLAALQYALPIFTAHPLRVPEDFSFNLILLEYRVRVRSCFVYSQ